MPQLDKVTFFSQFFWLCVFFLGFYSMIHKYFLPRICRILKLRKKKITMSLLSFANQEIDQLRGSKDNILQESLKLSGSIFAEGSKLIHTSRDTSKVIHLLTEKYKNKPFFFTSEKLYVEFVGQSFVSNKSLLQLYSPDCAASPHSQLFDIYSFLQKKTQYNSRFNWRTRRGTGSSNSGEENVITGTNSISRNMTNPRTENFELNQTKKRGKRTKKAS
ncbi:ATP synthase F0 subunit 8 (mitochondrion) [Bryopsis sp. KO-2023]|nr:ATP synthase F0 subunit 8 [Bryopsis sp. KO-2023]